MKKFLLIMAGMIVAFALLSWWAGQPRAQTIAVERTAPESETLIILLGRACRGANDQDWLTICTAAVAQAQKEIEARKQKPAEPKQ